MVNPGQIGIINTTGEKVFVMSFGPADTAGVTTLFVRRPSLSEDGMTTYVREYFRADEILTYDEFLSLQLFEMKIKREAQRKFDEQEAAAIEDAKPVVN